MKALFLLFLVGCGTDMDNFRGNTIPLYQEPEFVPFISKFDSFYDTQVLDNFEMKFGEIQTEESPTRIGVCYYGGPWMIQIHKPFWDIASEDEKEALLFHEMGHCILHRPHTEEVMETPYHGKIPYSVMYPYIFARSPYYNVYRDHYYWELGEKIDKFMNLVNFRGEIE